MNRPQNDHHPWNVRALLEFTATPFTIVDYGPRAARSRVNALMGTFKTRPNNLGRQKES